METATKLTKAKLLSLPPGRDLDRLIAEIVYNARPCGNEKIKDIFVIIGDFRNNIVRPLKGHFRTAGWQTGIDNAWADIPFYSTELTDTWKLIEDHPFVFALQVHNIDNVGITEWMATDGTEHVVGKTMQEALCKLLLLTKIIIE